MALNVGINELLVGIVGEHRQSAGTDGAGVHRLDDHLLSATVTTPTKKTSIAGVDVSPIIRRFSQKSKRKKQLAARNSDGADWNGGEPPQSKSGGVDSPPLSSSPKQPLATTDDDSRGGATGLICSPIAPSTITAKIARFLKRKGSNGV